MVFLITYQILQEIILCQNKDNTEIWELLKIIINKPEWEEVDMETTKINNKVLIHLKELQLIRDSDVLYRSEEHTSELQSRPHLVCRLLLEKKKKKKKKQ